MATHYWCVPVEGLSELRRARHKIGCLLKDKKEQDLRMLEVVAHMDDLQEENRILKYEKVHLVVWWQWH